MARKFSSRTGVASPRPDAAPNIINQDDVGFMFQDLRNNDPRVWQAITSLRANPAPQAFYAEIILGGKQKAKDDVLTHPCILRLPKDPYQLWKVQSVILQDIAISCKKMPKDVDYIVDVSITRNKRQNYTSLFVSDSQLPRIRVNGDYYNKIEPSNIGTIELFDDDEFRVDIVQADDTVEDCWLVFRGTANLLKDKPENV